MPGDLRRTMERRRNQRVTATNSDMRRTQVEARAKVKGSGETRVTIDFPVLYASKPIMTFGGELFGGSTPEATNYPVISVVVLTWDTVERSDDRTYYRGCEVGIVALGKASQNMNAHILFEGIAFRDPTIGSGSLEDPI